MYSTAIDKESNNVLLLKRAQRIPISSKDQNLGVTKIIQIRWAAVRNSSRGSEVAPISLNNTLERLSFKPKKHISIF